MLKSAL